MKNLFLTICSALLFITGCQEGNNIGQFDNAVVENESNAYKFKQITFILNIQNSSNGYVNLNRIDSIKLKVNGKFWGTFTSEEIDTTYKTDKIADNIKYSNSKINYLIIAPYRLKTDNLITAGDFVDYLGDRIVLTPGDYVCEVSTIKFRDINHNWIVISPIAYTNFKVIENTTSSYAGEIEIEFNN